MQQLNHLSFIDWRLYSLEGKVIQHGKTLDVYNKPKIDSAKYWILL